MTAPTLLLFSSMVWTAAAQRGGIQLSALVLFVPFSFALGVGFGLIGSLIQLWTAFSLLDLIGNRLRVGRAGYILAGMGAGAVHMALAWLSTQNGWPKGLGGLLGTWFVAVVLAKTPIVAWASALPAGIAAGAVYAFIRFPMDRGRKKRNKMHI